MVVVRPLQDTQPVAEGARTTSKQWVASHANGHTCTCGADGIASGSGGVCILEHREAHLSCALPRQTKSSSGPRAPEKSQPAGQHDRFRGVAQQARGAGWVCGSPEYNFRHLRQMPPAEGVIERCHWADLERRRPNRIDRRLRWSHFSVDRLRIFFRLRGFRALSVE